MHLSAPAMSVSEPARQPSARRAAQAAQAAAANPAAPFRAPGRAKPGAAAAACTSLTSVPASPAAPRAAPTAAAAPGGAPPASTATRPEAAAAQASSPPRPWRGVKEPAKPVPEVFPLPPALDGGTAAALLPATLAAMDDVVAAASKGACLGPRAQARGVSRALLSCQFGPASADARPRIARRRRAGCGH